MKVTAVELWLMIGAFLVWLRIFEGLAKTNFYVAWVAILITTVVTAVGIHWWLN